MASVKASKNRNLAMRNVALAMAAAAGTACAADVTWDNGSTDMLWNTSSINWTGAAWNNASGDGAIFPGAGFGTINVPGPITARSINFQTGGYILGGVGPLSFTTAGASTLGSGVVSVATGSAATINTPISGAVALQKQGDGFLELGGAVTTTGPVVWATNSLDPSIQVTTQIGVGRTDGAAGGGQLTILNPGVLSPTATIGMFGSTLDLGSNNVTLGGLVFRNPFTNTVNGSGTITMNGPIHVLGDITGTSGNIINPNINMNGGTMLVRVGVVTFFALQNACVFNGVVSNGSLFKTYGMQDTGNQGNTDGFALYNNNTYTGSTTVNGGGVATGTNATTSLLVSGGGVGSGFILQGISGSLGSATTLTVIGGSNLRLDNNAAVTIPSFPAFQNNDRIRDDAAVTLRDATFSYVSLAATPGTETFGSLALTGGQNPVSMTPTTVASGGAVTLTCAGALTMAPRSTMTITTPSTGANAAVLGSAAARFFVNGALPAGDATGIIPRIICTNTADFVTYSGATGFTPYAGYTLNSFATPGANVALSAATATAGSVSINALKTTATLTTTLTGTDVLSVASGMVYSASGTHTISGTGTLAMGATPGIFWGTNTLGATAAISGTQGLVNGSGTLTLAGNLAGLAGEITVNSGTVNLNTATYTGSVRVRTGTLSLGTSQTSLGTVTLGVTEQDPQLFGTTASMSFSAAGAGATFNHNIVVDNGTQSFAGNPLPSAFMCSFSPLSNTTGSQTFNGNLTLNSPLNLQGGGGGNGVYGSTNFNGAISGPAMFYIPNGRVNFNAGSTISNGGLRIGNGGFSAMIAMLGTATGNAPITIIGGNQTSLKYAGPGSIFTGPITIANATGASAPRVYPLSTCTITNQFNLNGDVVPVVAGGITGTWAGPITGASAINKIGVTITQQSPNPPLSQDNTGTLVLSSGSNSYTGAMTVGAGTLLVNGSFPGASATATITASPAAAGTLGGTGTIGGSVTVATGGTLAPGASIGTLNTGHLSVAGEMLCEIDTAAPGADLVNVTGTVTLNGNLNLAVAGSGSGTFIIVKNDGADAVSGTFGAVLNAPAGTTVNYAFTGTDTLGRVGDGNDVAVEIAGGGCYANCDASTSAPVLNVADFTCFLQKYAGNDPYANCDLSTTAPTLNVADFTCFLTKFAAGCP